MELTMFMKGNKYIIQDKKASRQIYTIKKKGFGSGSYVLLDASNYRLYSFMQITEERKPTFIISHNDVSIMQLSCRSLFLDPTITVEGKDLQREVIKYDVASKDHKNFQIIKDGNVVGSVKTKYGSNSELQYDFDIEDKVFDDYIPLFVLAVDLTFGEMNQAP